MKTSRGFVVEQLLAHGEDCSGTLCILIQQRSVGDRKKLSPTFDSPFLVGERAFEYFINIDSSPIVASALIFS